MGITQKNPLLSESMKKVAEAKRLSGEYKPKRKPKVEAPVVETVQKPKEEVIVEGVSKRNEGVMTGRTRQNKLVHFPSAEPIRVGSYANVLVTSAARHFLRGELREVTAAPTHKVRLSVAAL